MSHPDYHVIWPVNCTIPGVDIHAYHWKGDDYDALAQPVSDSMLQLNAIASQTDPH